MQLKLFPVRVARQIFRREGEVRQSAEANGALRSILATPHLKRSRFGVLCVRLPPVHFQPTPPS